MTGSAQTLTETKPDKKEGAESEVQTRERCGQSDLANDWLCAWCLNRVASEKDRYSHNGQNEFSFTNPEGIRFEILTFSQTPGCKERGVPTLDHTWFPAYAWSYCVCAGCGTHLGWHYTGPGKFTGLIRERILRASVLMS